MVFAPKTDCTLRSCVLFRRLNDVARRETYIIPRMGDSSTAFEKNTIFSTIDVNKAYRQTEIQEANRKERKSMLHNKLYCLIRTLFGPCNTPGAFRRAESVFVVTVKWQFALVNVANILIYYQIFQERIGHGCEEAALLRNRGVTLNLKKRLFFSETSEYLAHINYPSHPLRLKIAVYKTDASNESQSFTH